jgi:amino acid adenylation domain-containing protein
MSPSGPERLLHAHLEAQARRTPQAVAFHDQTRSITFAELDAGATRVARALAAAGIGGGSTVGLHVERSIAWVVAIVGILKANAAAMPLPPSYPRGRLRAILDHAELDLVIDAAEARIDSSLAKHRLALEDLGTGGTTALPLPPGAADQAAFVLCSSGSTGTPKMIVRSHASFFHRLEWTSAHHPFAPGEVGLQKAHATTTHAIYELFEPLLGGAPAVIVPDEITRDLERFWDVVRSRGVSRLLIVPSALQASLDMPGFVPPPLRVVVLMGEYVSPHLAEQAVARFPADTRIYSIYGSTEASSTLVCDLRESLVPGRELPLGHAISPNVQVCVLGTDLEPVPEGSSGRLHIGGPPLFTEYFRDPAQTRSVTVHRPGRQERLYDTHDEVRSLPGGALEFVGRIDDTVKIRGFRVDLQEVERALRSHRGVGNAAVLVRDDGAGGRSLHAFVTPASTHQGAAYDTLRDRLPAYMVPSALTALDAFPLTPRGKLDRERLLQAGVATDAGGATGRTLSAVERRVGAVWQRVLEHRRYGADTSFFEAGGTSLTAFALIHHLRNTFGLDRAQLPADAAYRCPTIETMAAHIERVAAGTGVETPAAVPLLVTMRRGTAPLPPLFLIASAGGTLGAYEKLARTLKTSRDVIGVRDPYLWGQRELSESFQRWAGRYAAAIRERQPRGPYHVVAYSSAGSVGYEVARQLRASGEPVAILVLVDPLALDRPNRWRYGWWALRATYARPSLRALIRLAGWLRLPLHRLRRARTHPPSRPDYDPSPDEIRRMAAAAVRNRGHIETLAALFELNTGLPITLDDSDFAGRSPDEYLTVLQNRLAAQMPEIEPDLIARLVVQYSVQVSAQHAYELRSLDCPVLLVEPVTRYRGIARAHLRPYIRRLQTRAISLAPPSPRIRAITDRFGAIEAHYRSMRDDRFVEGLAREIERALDVRPADEARHDVG